MCTFDCQWLSKSPHLDNTKWCMGDFGHSQNYGYLFVIAKSRSFFFFFFLFVYQWLGSFQTNAWLSCCRKLAGNITIGLTLRWNSLCTTPDTVILQIFGVVLFSVVNGFTEIKKTPKCEKNIARSWQHPRTPKFKRHRTLHARSPPKICKITVQPTNASCQGLGGK